MQVEDRAAPTAESFGDIDTSQLDTTESAEILLEFSLIMGICISVIVIGLLAILGYSWVRGFIRPVATPGQDVTTPMRGMTQSRHEGPHPNNSRSALTKLRSAITGWVSGLAQILVKPVNMMVAIAHLLPIFGILWLGWSLVAVITVYSVEGAIIGLGWAVRAITAGRAKHRRNFKDTLYEVLSLIFYPGCGFMPVFVLEGAGLAPVWPTHATYVIGAMSVMILFKMWGPWFAKGLYRNADDTEGMGFFLKSMVIFYLMHASVVIAVALNMSALLLIPLLTFNAIVEISALERSDTRHAT